MFAQEHPELHRLEDLAIKTGIEDLLKDPSLFHVFRNHDRVHFEERVNLYRYKVSNCATYTAVRMLNVVRLASQPDYDINSKDSLLQLLKQHVHKGGLPIKVLRESWPAVLPALEDLQQQGLVLLTRTMGATGNEEKEGPYKMAFYDPLGKPAESVDRGLLLLTARVDASSQWNLQTEFRDLWNKLETPNEVDLPKELRAGPLSFASLWCINRLKKSPYQRD